MRAVNWKRVGDYLVYLAVRVFVCTVQAMRLESCERVAAGLATLATDVLRLRRDVIEENLSIAFPRLDPARRRRLVWRMWRHLFLMVAEIAHSPRKIHPSNWRRYITIRDRLAVKALLDDGRPKVFVSGHFGNFELCAFALGLWGYPTYNVARPLDNPFLHDFVNRFRGMTGHSVLPKRGSSTEIERVLAGGGLVGVLGDQAAGAKGCWVDFFGRPASTHKAVAVFALSNNAPLLVGYARRLGRPLCYEIGVEAIADPKTMPPELTDVNRLTQWHAAALERLIRRDPEQYWWVHRRWKGAPPARKRRAA
jgi:KDO2-lipid IV(A) lauroyltransferase